MSGTDADVPAPPEAGRHDRTDRADRVLAQRIDALARRAAREYGAVRRLLDARVEELRGRHAREVARPATHGATDRASASGVRDTGLSTLLGAFSGRREEIEAAREPAATAWHALRHVDDVRRMSSRVRVQSQLRQALGRPPENAGPLNSASLVHRALGLMRDLSPEYLQSFAAYVDGLAQLEGLDTGDGPAARHEVSGAAGARRPRGRARNRRA